MNMKIQLRLLVLWYDNDINDISRTVFDYGSNQR